MPEINRTIQTANFSSDYVSVKDFGAVGDGVTDDTAALQAALDSGGQVYFPEGVYTVSSQLSVTLTSSFSIASYNAEIKYNGTHAQTLLTIADTSGVEIKVSNIKLNGNKLVNKVLEVKNETSLTTATKLIISDAEVTGAERSNAFSGGNGIRVYGSFESVDMVRCNVNDCELPSGQGTAGVIGISGIGISDISSASYAKVVRLRDCRIEKIYSSDLSYTSDQDGINCQGGTGSSGLLGKLIVDGCEFLNCYGRSVKTQNQLTIVSNSTFQRTEGLTGGVGNPEIDAQSGDLVTKNNSFHYLDSQIPSTVVNLSSTSNQHSRLCASMDTVYLDNATNLEAMYFCFASGNEFAPHVISQAKVIGGEVERFVDWTVSTSYERLTVEDCQVDEITTDSTTSDKSLIFIRTSTGSSQQCYIDANGNSYLGAGTAYIVRDSVTGTAMDADFSGMRNIGFVDSWDSQMNDNDPANIQAIRTRLAPPGYGEKGYLGLQSKAIANGATETFAFRGNLACLVEIVGSSGVQAYGLLMASDSNTNVISSGTQVSIGTTSDPAVSGDFNVWVSGAGTLSIRNDTGSTRTVIVKITAPN